MSRLKHEQWWETHVVNGKYYTIDQFKKITGDKDSRRAYLEIVSNGDKVLDVGCGLGLDFEYYNKNGVSVVFVGLDVTFGFISFNSTNYQDANFINGKCYELPFKNKVFDVCTCRHLLEHVADPIKTIKEMCRVANQVAIIWFIPPGDTEKIRLTRKGFYKNIYKKNILINKINNFGASVEIKDISLEGKNHQLWKLTQ